MKAINLRRGVNLVSLGLIALATLGLLVSCGEPARARSSVSWFDPASQMSFDVDRQSVIVSDVWGGSPDEFAEYYSALDRNSIKLRIEGVCASACTYFLGLMHPSLVCATDGAIFAFHGVYTVPVMGGTLLGGDAKFDPEATIRWHERVYPPKVRDLLAALGFDGTRDVDRAVYRDGVIYLNRHDLEIRRCVD